MRMQKLIGLFLLSTVACAPVELQDESTDVPEELGAEYHQVPAAAGDPTLTLVTMDDGYTGTYAVENWVYPAAGRGLECYVDNGAYVGWAADGATDGLTYTFQNVPIGYHRLCCVLTEDGEELSNCSATACVTIQESVLCDSLGDPICDDQNPASAEACLWDSNLQHRKCVYGAMGTGALCLSKYDCSCEEGMGYGLCVGNVCSLCASDLACDDGDPCTIDACDNTGCIHDPVNGFCFDHDDCVDEDPCTLGWCTADDSPAGCPYCRQVPVHDPGCCDPAQGPADCDDGDPCTVAWCDEETLSCTFATISIPDQVALDLECCSVHGDCQSGGIWEENPLDDPATLDLCNLGQCVRVLDPSLWECESDPDCDDGLPLTVDQCLGYTCVIDAPDCDVDADCFDGNGCTADWCIAGSCKWAPIVGCCLEDQECDDGNDCTIDTCVVEAGEEGGACESAIDLGQGGGGVCCLTGGDCADGIVCSQDYCLDNHCYHQFDVCDCYDWECSDGDACTCDFCLGDAFCVHIPLEEAPSFPQCNIPVLCCNTSDDCIDANPCLAQECIDNLCTYTPDPDAPSDCCDVDQDCDDGLPLTEDACAGFFCVNLVPGCGAPVDCDDGDPCTGELCINGSCKWKPNPECCMDDSSCDDGNLCTIDGCTSQPGSESGLCEHAVDYGQGGGGVCCATSGDCADGDASTGDFCLDHMCYHVPTQCCCDGWEPACADDDPCTCDFCHDCTCVHVPVKYLKYVDWPWCNIPLACCSSDEDCDQGGPCSEGECVQNLCQYTPIPGCFEE